MSSLAAAIKRAKKSIQSYILEESVKKRDKAEKDIEEADRIAELKGRKDWRTERLIVPHYDLREWYSKTWKGEKEWDLDEKKMPRWAYNGKNEPEEGEEINGITYTKAPKSCSR
jgi:hypothetical protein